jgi:hypothetical protein
LTNSNPFGSKYIELNVVKEWWNVASFWTLVNYHVSQFEFYERGVTYLILM